MNIISIEKEVVMVEIENPHLPGFNFSPQMIGKSSVDFIACKTKFYIPIVKTKVKIFGKVIL